MLQKTKSVEALMDKSGDGAGSRHTLLVVHALKNKGYL